MKVYSKKNLPNLRVKEAKKIVKNIKTADLGGAEGTFISHLVNPSKITVIDLNEAALKKNSSKEKIYGDLRKIPLKDNTFSQVTLFEVIEHIQSEEDRLKVFSEAKRILKKRGRLILSTPNKERFSTQIRKLIFRPRKYPYSVYEEKGVTHTDFHYFEYNPYELIKDLKKVGFKKIKLHTKFLQIPFIQAIFNIYSKWGLVLYATAEK